MPFAARRAVSSRLYRSAMRETVSPRLTVYKPSSGGTPAAAAISRLGSASSWGSKIRCPIEILCLLASWFKATSLLTEVSNRLAIRDSVSPRSTT